MNETEKNEEMTEKIVTEFDIEDGYKVFHRAPTMHEVDTFENVEAFSIYNNTWEMVCGKYIRKYFVETGDGGYREFNAWRIPLKQPQSENE